LGTIPKTLVEEIEREGRERERERREEKRKREERSLHRKCKLGYISAAHKAVQQ